MYVRPHPSTPADVHWLIIILLQIKRLVLNESSCKPPLVETDHEANWYEGIEGCGIQCKNPIFNREEHTRIHRFVAAFSALTTFCTLFTIVSICDCVVNVRTYVLIILYNIDQRYHARYHARYHNSKRQCLYVLSLN